MFAPLRGHGGRQAQYLTPETLRNHLLKPALYRAGLPSTVRVHDLRHTSASLLIQLGGHPKAIMERLGHSDIGTTMNRYGHLFDSLEEQLTDKLDELHAKQPQSRGKTAAVVALA